MSDPMIFRPQGPDAVSPLQDLLSEALAVCHAGDPTLGAALANILDLELKMRPGAKPARQNPAEARLMSFRMLIYAYHEALETEGHEVEAEKLKFCIVSLSEQLGCADAGARPLHS
jgi:hypothetical protein